MSIIKENCKVTNNSNVDLSQLENIVARFYPYVKEKLKFDKDVDVNLISDPENAKDPWGKTAYYDPTKMKITIFVDNRHPKDMLRSLSHELVHHAQNCRGKFDQAQALEPGYAQNDPHMRRMEGEAYLLGNGFLVRDFEDSLKSQQNQNLTENKKMKGLTNEQLKTVLENTIKRVIKEAQWEREHVRLPGGSYGRPGSNKPEVDLPKRYSGLDKAACKRQGYMAYSASRDECYNIGEGQVNEEEEVIEETEEVTEDLNETFTSKKNHMLFEKLTKKWAK